MPIELTLILLGALLVAMVVTLVEMRSSLTPARCTECAHCRQLAYEAQLREERELSRLDDRIWEIEQRDERERRNRR